MDCKLRYSADGNYARRCVRCNSGKVWHNTRNKIKTVVEVKQCSHNSTQRAGGLKLCLDCKKFL